MKKKTLWNTQLFNKIYPKLFRIVPCALKRFLLRQCGAQINSSLTMDKNILITGKLENLTIGLNVNIQKNTVIAIYNEMIIEDNVTIGSNCEIGHGHTPLKNTPVHIGSNTAILPGVSIDTTGGIDIGKNVIITKEVVIYTHEHNFKRDQLIITQGITHVPGTTIGDDVYIGYHSTILGGVKIASGAVIGAMSIVTKDVSEYSIVAGSPAKKIGDRV